MRVTIAAVFAFVSLTAVSLPATAQVQCKLTDDYNACSNSAIKARKAALANETEATATEAVAAMNTGDNQESTTNDFLPLLRLLLNDNGAEDEGQKIGFEWAPHFSKTLPSKLTLSLQDSQLYAPLDTALDDADLGDQGETLGKQIDAGDDIAVAFTITKSSEKYGRDPEQQKLLLGALLEPADEDEPRELKELRGKMDAFRRDHSIKPNTTFGDITDKVVQGEYLALAHERIGLEIAHLEKFAANLDKLGFNGLLNLIDNQPQFTLTLEFESRDEAVGPDEGKATLAYEFGGRSVNTFRHYAKHDCPDKVDGDALASQVACLGQYLTTQETIAESFRVKIAAEYSKIQSYEFALADTTFSYTEKPVEHLSFSVAASRQIGNEGTAGPRPRFDLKASYEDFSDDPVRQDRGVATATFSYPVSPGFFLTLGAVYATKPEFRGEVDEEISARLGLTYKLIPDK